MNLVSPCSYQGGKQRVAKEIVDYILNTTFLSKDTKSSLEFTKRILDLNISEKEKVEMLKLLFGGND